MNIYQQPAAPSAPRSFPDKATCHIKKSGVAGYFTCQNTWRRQCPHLLVVDEENFCRCPETMELPVGSANAFPSQFRAGILHEIEFNPLNYDIDQT
jgi:hypothetical protein